MYSVEVVRVFNRTNESVTFYKVVDGRKVKISKAEYYRLDSIAFDSDTFYTASDGSITRNGKALKFLYNPFKE